MGTWDIGPFENDMAADFAFALDEVAETGREAMVRQALITAISTQGYLDSSEGAEAVAAAALVAARCPGGKPVSSVYGPKEPMPAFADDLRACAAEALDRVLAADSELAELWGESGDDRWRQSVIRLRETVVRRHAVTSSR
ncbi:hypothetical protein SNS2_5416 [Streptomyces netropsis]|uniref:DUF4259 domain-containing protein n=1 Tax=Streptomyces syringium TaxID=76729 RepID=A0ABS4YBX7_9ACTN|nr:DUF4259 domain-containing protein [Streptomyces syringium]MBP2406010.1 hypothetical protein [Streptomyces syringium]SPE64089.1 hypothetical protein SNS2_5416 [Streptomyces netropsis]